MNDLSILSIDKYGAKPLLYEEMIKGYKLNLLGKNAEGCRKLHNPSIVFLEQWDLLGIFFF